ncbi:hypothetical protein [Rhodoblastus sp.]|uniref:hypothetical protein n=1 Tax=Rhodoblastus sp. TaxID=1962975 RepID=UPI00261064AF|nr:hypothetical protein [Rhodoblastus sp.]
MAFWFEVSGGRQNPFALLSLLAYTAFGVLAMAPLSQAQAQSIVASINGDPVTSYDVAERAKLLRAIGEPSSPSAALDSLIESRVKATEINKYGIKVSASDLGPALHYYAEKGHMTVEQLSQRVSAAHVDQKHAENFFSIHQAFLLYARARNRAVEVSKEDLDAELARDKSLAQERTYTLRQVVYIVPPSAGQAGIEEAAKKMEALKSRFNDCDGGVKIARETAQFVVRDPITRTSSQLGPQLSAVLDKVPLGHLTPASRDSSGIAAVAVCERKEADADARKDLAQQKLLQNIVEKQAAELYKDLRASAVIVKTGK